MTDPFAALRDVAVPATYVFAVAVIAVEALVMLATRKRFSNRSGLASIFSGITSFAMLAVADRLWFAVLAVFAWSHRVVDLGGGPFAWLATFVVYDLMFYTAHRAGHEVRLLWCFHGTHHTTDEMRLTSAVRGSVFDFVYLPWFFVWMPVCGVHPSMLLVVESFARMWGILTHISPHFVGRLGWLEGLWTTPSAHRVHHGRELPYLDRNYSESLILWDRLFGTYTPEKIVPTYGLTVPVDAGSYAAIQLGPWRALWRDLRRARSWTARFRYLFDAPGWDEDGPDRRVRTVQRAALASGHVVDEDR